MLTLERSFEHAVHDLAMGLGCDMLGPRLGIKPGYLRRQANPHDDGAHFRARDLIPVSCLALDRLPVSLAVAPLMLFARALGYGVFPLAQSGVSPASVLDGFARVSACLGEFGAASLVAVSPHGDQGGRVTPRELAPIEAKAHALQSHVGGVVHACRGLAGVDHV